MDRRTLPRYPCPDLCVTSRSSGLGGIFERTPRRLHPLGYNHAGLAVLAPMAAGVGKRLQLQLSFGALHITRLDAIVQNCRAHPEGYRLGLHFECSSVGYRTFERMLHEIEHILASRLAATSIPTPARNAGAVT